MDNTGVFSWNINGIKSILPPQRTKITSFFWNQPFTATNSAKWQSDSAPFYPATLNWPEALFLQDLNIQPGNTAALAALLSSHNTPLSPARTTRHAQPQKPTNPTVPTRKIYIPQHQNPEATGFQPHALLSLEQHVEGELVVVSCRVPGDEAGLLTCCGGVVGRCWGGGGLVVREGKIAVGEREGDEDGDFGHAAGEGLSDYVPLGVESEVGEEAGGQGGLVEEKPKRQQSKREGLVSGGHNALAFIIYRRDIST
jgi:hypothetical protein